MRSRARRLAAAGAVVLAVLAVAGCTAAPASAPLTAAERAAGIAPSVEVGGRTIPFTGLQTWTTASIGALTERTLTVFAVDAGDRGGDPCGPPVVRLHTVERSTTVTVLVADYQLPALPNQACGLALTLPSPHVVMLAAPLGSRAVLDGSGGKAVSVLDGERYPDLPTAPADWGRPVLEAASYGGAVVRQWSLDLRAGRWVRLVSELPREVRDVPPIGAVAAQIDVHGSPATVYRVPGTGYDVQWTPNRTHTVSLALDGRGWTTADAVRFARAVTGYRTVATGRLAQPAAPGTVEAVFNSADGPVDGMLVLLESSTASVALDCEGAGRVEVTVRGAIRPFTCTSTLSHHLTARRGVPHLQFPVSVHATAGVRWALTLAVATLDGS